MVFGSTVFLHKMEPALFFKPVIYPHPRARGFGVSLAHPVCNPAARAVEETLRAFGVRAYAARVREHALSAERAALEEPAVSLDGCEEHGVERWQDRGFFSCHVRDRPDACAAGEH